MSVVPALFVMIKPVSGSCNLRCAYCFYADEMRNREIPSYGKMDDETMEELIRKSLARARNHMTFAFQGGEPTLAGLSFYERFTDCVEKYRKPGQQIHYALQTNGMCIDEKWARFLGERRFLVGLSLDGPRKLHDHYRLDPQGGGSFQRVMLAAKILREYRVDVNVLAVVTAYNAPRIGSIYSFFHENRLDYQQYIPCIDPFGGTKGEQPYSLTAEAYGQFLCDLFDLWYEDVTRGRFIYIRMFENLVGMLRGYPPESCDMGGRCSVQYVVEADGGVYPCDFYALDEWRLGNIRRQSYEELDKRREELAFIEPSALHPESCESCRWHSLCRNGCRRDRPVLEEGMLGQNLYCKGFQRFYKYAYPRLLKLR